jgi:hypothetical protein
VLAKEYQETFTIKSEKLQVKLSEKLSNTASNFQFQSLSKVVEDNNFGGILSDICRLVILDKLFHDKSAISQEYEREIIGEVHDILQTVKITLFQELNVRDKILQVLILNHDKDHVKLSEKVNSIVFGI